MNPDPASLENLQDIVTPPPVSWWPPAPGWWILFAVFLIGAGVIGYRRWRNWRANAYRRVALGALNRATTIPEIAEILKRAALAAYSRTEVAPLAGDAWLKWLQQTLGEPAPEKVLQALGQGAYAETTQCDVTEVAQFAARWVRGHRGSKSSGLHDET